MRKLVFLLLFLAAPALSAQNVSQIKLAGRDVALWKPSGPAPETGYPIIVFSHGFGGCNTQSTFLMEALAQAGYLVLAPNHKDARRRNALQGEERRAARALPPRRLALFCGSVRTRQVLMVVLAQVLTSQPSGTCPDLHKPSKVCLPSPPRFSRV